MKESWLVLLPILLPVLGFILGLFTRRLHRLQVGIVIAAMLASLGSASLLLFTVVTQNNPVVYQIGGWQAPFGITLIGDYLSSFMVLMSQLVLTAGLLHATGCQDKCIRFPAFFPLFLLLVTGLTGTFLTGDLFNLFVFAELMVIAGAVLTAISDDQFGVEAAYKYFYISLLASMFILIACGALYASYGTLNIADLAQRINENPDAPLAGLSMVFLLAFFMIKSAVVPFHFWQPDFHTASPTPVSAMLSSVVVKLGVYGFIRMVTLLFIDQAPAIRTLLITLGCLGVIIGGLGAVGTANAKRMLAYSTLGQIGFILVGIGWGTSLSLAAALIFTFNHSLIKSAMLMLAGAVASRAAIKSAAFDVIIGVGKSTQPAGILFVIGGIALAGLPPTNGFISKLVLFQSGIEAQSYLPLAVIGLVSLLTLVYIIRSFMKIWWQVPEGGVKIKPGGDRLIIPAVLVIGCLALGIWAQPLVSLALKIAQWVSEPALYIQAVIGK